MLRFIYTDAKGQTAEWALTHWKENTVYLQGRCEGDSFPRTFRKDRVQEYLAGHEDLLFDLAPPAPEPAPKAAPDDRPEVHFTGFRAADKARLEALAEVSGLRIVKSATRSLAILCTGYNASAAKVEKAREAGAFVLSEEHFARLLETGELPC